MVHPWTHEVIGISYEQAHVSILDLRSARKPPTSFASENGGINSSCILDESSNPGPFIWELKRFIKASLADVRCLGNTIDLAAVLQYIRLSCVERQLNCRLLRGRASMQRLTSVNKRIICT